MSSESKTPENYSSNNDDMVPIRGRIISRPNRSESDTLSSMRESVNEKSHVFKNEPNKLLGDIDQNLDIEKQSFNKTQNATEFTGVKLPPLFPCAWKVKIPIVGDQREKPKENYFPKNFTNLKYESDKSYMPKKYFKLISSDLQFGKDVITDRIPKLLTYDMKKLRSIFDPTDIVRLNIQYLRGCDTPSSTSSMYSLSAPIGPKWLVGASTKEKRIVAGAVSAAKRKLKNGNRVRNIKLTQRSEIDAIAGTTWTNKTFGINSDLLSGDHFEVKTDPVHENQELFNNKTANWIANQNKQAELTKKNTTTDENLERSILMRKQEKTSQSNEKKNYLLHDEDSSFKKENRLQDIYPLAPQQWLVKRNSGNKKKIVWKKGYPEIRSPEDTNEGRLYCGMRRWKSENLISDETPVTSCTGIRSRHSATKSKEASSSAKQYKQPETRFSTPIELETDSASEDMVKIRRTKSVTKIAEQWREKWSSAQRWDSTTTTKLLQELKDVQPQLRLQALNTITRAAETQERVVAGEDSTESSSKDSFIPNQVTDEVEALLQDENASVRRAAAICIFSIGSGSSLAEKIMRQALYEANKLNRWTAARILAIHCDADSDVINEIITHIIETNDPIKNEQGMAILKDLSASRHYVHSLLADRLNSASWQERIKACLILPSLKKSLNRDITNKLASLMWNDWHKEVRKSAAQALGKSGNGKIVHSVLIQKMKSSKENVRNEALLTLGNLGIVTGKVLPLFLSAFEDEYISVRRQACLTASQLKSEDEGVMNHLENLAKFDPDWNVKVHAIKAISSVNAKTESIKSSLLWAMRYEDNPQVRAEACKSLLSLRYVDEDVKQTIQDRFLVESSEFVKQELQLALEAMGIETTKEMDLVLRIKGEVRKLGAQENIIQQLNKLEQQSILERNEQRLAEKSKSDNRYE